MGIRVDVSGSRDLARFAHALHQAGKTDLSAELNRGLRAAGKDVITEVRRHTDDYMPAGYEKTFTGSLKLETQVQLIKNNRVSVVGFGLGRSRRRDAVRLDEGELRHPVYGRRRRLKSGRNKANPWAVQRIRPGWFSEPAMRALPQVRRQIDDAVGRVAAKIERAG